MLLTQKKWQTHVENKRFHKDLPFKIIAEVINTAHFTPPVLHNVKLNQQSCILLLKS